MDLYEVLIRLLTTFQLNTKDETVSKINVNFERGIIMTLLNFK